MAEQEITTQKELTRDAVTRGIKPGAIVTLRDRETRVDVQITSWPWREHGSNQIMARMEPGNCMTNTPILYSGLTDVLRMEPLD